jgi:hypothetical protein
MQPRILVKRRSASPIGVGASPRLLMLALVATAAAACNGSSGDQVTPPIALGMTSSMAATYDDGQMQMYTVQVPVPLPVRQPTAAEMSGKTPAGTPYPYAPFLKADDEQLEIHYTLSNIDDTDHSVWLLIYPWNEFVRWKPGITIVDMEAAVPNYGYDQYVIVPAKSRLQGTITTDDTHEIAIKLASVENMLAQTAPMGMGMSGGTMMNYGTQDPTTLANHLFNPQNRSNMGDPLFTPWIPPVIAGLTGFDLGLRTQGGAANLAVEITIDITDVTGNHFIPQGQKGQQIGIPPMTLSPPGAL